MKTLKDKFNMGYPIATYKSVVNSKGQRFYVEESSSLEKINELQFKIMLDVKEHLNDFTYLLQFWEGKILFDDLRNDCINYFKSKYDINIMDLTLTESFKSIFGEFKK